MNVLVVVLDAADSSPLAGVRVEAWDVDVPPGQGEPVASGETSSAGDVVLDLPTVPSGSSPSLAADGTQTIDTVLRCYLGSRLLDVSRQRLQPMVIGISPSLLPVGRPGNLQPGRPPILRPPLSTRPRVVVNVNSPFATVNRLFGRAIDESGQAMSGVTLGVWRPETHQVEQVNTGFDGRFKLQFPSSGSIAFVCWTGPLASAQVAQPIDWSVLPEDGTSLFDGDVTFAREAQLQVEGRVANPDTGAGLPGYEVELQDRAQRWPSPLVATSTDSDGAFDLTFVRLVAEPPAPTFVVRRAGQTVANVPVSSNAWQPEGRLVDVHVDVRLGGGTATPYVLRGQLIDKVSRQGAARLRVEAWTGQTMLGAADTDEGGAFVLGFSFVDRLPFLTIRVYAGALQVAQLAQVPVSWTAMDEARVLLEVDAPVPVPPSFRIVGRAVDAQTRNGLAGLRLEAWDRNPRPGGGTVGAAGMSAADGSFSLDLPAEPDGSAREPSIFFRIYSGSTLIDTSDGAVSWSSGVGSTLLEVVVPADGSAEVGLHELGESVASTIDRVQTELDRYPTTMGAFVLDELDIDMPVVMRVDALGQIRTAVVDQTVARDTRTGQLRMRVKPVLGSAARTSDVPDQPLSALPELDDLALRVLQDQRIWSVEDLLRTAQAPAGYQALSALGLGVNLDDLLARALLLTLTVLPRRVREALVTVGVASAQSFADTSDRDDLARRLGQALHQPEITAADVATWQQHVRELLLVPLPRNDVSPVT